MNNGSVRGFCRGRYTTQELNAKGDFVPVYHKKSTALTLFNKAAKENAIAARKALLAQGVRIYTALFYRHLHATKGFRKVPV